MDNPFKELTAQRQIKEQEMRKMEAEERKKRYDSQVRGILQHLQQVAYPNYYVSAMLGQASKIEPYYNDLIWHILRHYEDDEGRHYTDIKVTVCLEVNASDEYESFLVSCPNSVNASCGLSEEELIDTLKRLHPPDCI